MLWNLSFTLVVLWSHSARSKILYCDAIDFKKYSLSETTIFVSETTAAFTWYEAVCCCRKRGLELLSPTSSDFMKRVKSVVNPSKYMPFGWVDTYYNKGTYRLLMTGQKVNTDLYDRQLIGDTETPTPNKCLELTVNFLLTATPCDTEHNEAFICETRKYTPGNCPSVVDDQLKPCDKKADILSALEKNYDHKICSIPPTEPPVIVKNDPISEVDVAVSVQQKLSWKEARRRCEDSDVSLLVIETAQENNFVNSFERLKQEPFKKAEEGFWTGARFKTAEYKDLIWEPNKKPVLNFRNTNTNGITRTWAPGEPKDNSGKGKDLCVEMKFPGDKPPVWSATDCDEQKHYICIRPGPKRDPKNRKVVIKRRKKQRENCLKLTLYRICIG